MKKRTVLAPESLAEFFSVCFSCWFLSIGINLLIDVQFVDEFGVGAILLQSLVAISLCALFSRKWWIPIAIIGIPLFLFGLLILLNKNMAFYGEYAVNFIKWCISGLQYNSQWYTKGNVDFAHFLANVGVTTLVFAIQRLTRKSWISAFLSLGIIIITYMSGYTQYNKIAILFFFVGTFTLMATDEFNGHKLFRHGSVFTNIGSKWAVNIISLILCFTISAGALATLNNNKKLDIRNRFCSNIAADVQTAADFYTTEQQELDITLYDLGLQKSKKYLGGSLPKSASKVLAETNLKSPTLLKITTFDTYNGKKWSDSFEKSYRLNGPWENNQKAYLSGRIAYDMEKYAILSDFYSKKQVEITLKESSFFLPTVEQTLSLTENTNSKNPILFDERGRLISYFPQEKGFSYTLDSFSFELAIPDKMQYLALSNLLRQRDTNYTKSFHEHYTELKVPLPENVVSDLKRLELKGKNPYTILQGVLSYLSAFNGFSYSEKLDDIPKKNEICSTFFKYKKGHCVHYSTAIISMLRHLNVPARLAAGYRTVNNEKGVQVINTSSPFCWVECYLPNIGWISIDPTPHKQTIGGAAFVYDSEYKPPKKEEPEPEPQSPMEVPEPDDEEPDIKPNQKTIDYAHIFKTLAYILLTAYILLRGFWSPSVYKPSSMRLFFKSPKKQAFVYWRGISRQLKYLGFSISKHETLREQYYKISDSLNEIQNDVLLSAVCICEEIFYSTRSFDNEAAVQLYTAVNMLDGICRERKNSILYYIRRCIRPLF